MKNVQAPSRRSLLVKGLAAMAAGRLSISAAVPQNRVLICIYLFGGNDSNNMIVPLDQYSSYSSARRTLALTPDSLLPVKSKNQVDYGFHPALGELRDLFQSRALAVLSNVGALEQPGLADPGDRSLGYLRDGFTAPGWAVALSGAGAAFTEFGSSLPHRSRGGSSLISPGGPTGSTLTGVVQSSLRSHLSLQTQFPSSGLGHQLRQIAKVIALSGLGRQIYLCPLSGFDTSADQLARHESLLRELSPALAAFYQATVELGVSERVTAFTDTEFNRTLVPNGRNGTDHGWGGHHLIMGGAVSGGEVYGRFPTLVPRGPDDATGAGVWRPGIARDQYSVTMARWLGIENHALRRVFPSLPGPPPASLEFLA